MLALATIALALAPVVPSAPSTFSLTSGEVTFEIEAPLDTIRGVARSTSGSITLDAAAWTAAPVGDVSVDLASFRTGIDLRDLDLRDQFFETAKFGQATLKVTSLERPNQPALEKGVSGEAFARGTLSLHGVERPIEFPIKVLYDDAGGVPSLGVSGAFVVSLEQFAMKRPQRLLFKLGKDVKVVVRARFRSTSTSTSPAPATVLTSATLAPPPIVIARTPPTTEKPPAPPKFVFPPASYEGKGERYFVDVNIGGAGNAVSCAACHAVHDERLGLAEPVSKQVPPASSLWGVAKRASLWRGIGRSPGHAASLCARMFMLRSDNLAPEVETTIGAYLTALSKDPLPAHDYSPAIGAKRKTVAATAAELPKGDLRRGPALVQRTCARCHGKGKMRPELTPGLYTRELIAGRVRGARGNDAVQMPAYDSDRLTDSELADIIAFLTDEKQKIFSR